MYELKVNVYNCLIYQSSSSAVQLVHNKNTFKFSLNTLSNTPYIIFPFMLLVSKPFYTVVLFLH